MSRMKIVTIVSFAALMSAGASTDLDVRAFGAKGDGVTDDTEAFQRAANALRNASKPGHRGFGGRNRSERGGAAEGPHPLLVIPAGKYRLTNKVIFMRDIFVRGEDGAEIVQENPKADAFYCLGAYRTRIENLTFRGGRTQIALPTRNCESANLRIVGCRFFGSSAAAVESLSYGDYVGAPRVALPKDRYGMYEARPKPKDAKYERVSEWNYDRKTDSYFRDPRIDEPQYLVVDYHSTLMTVEDCLFDGCATSVRMHPDGGVIRNCRFLTSPASVGGAVFAWNSLHAYGNEFLLRGDGRRQSAFHCEGRTTFWIESSRIVTEDRSGACVLEGVSIPHNQAAQVVLDDLVTDTGLGRGNAICRWTHGRFPNIAVVRNVRAKGPNPVEAMAFEPELTDESVRVNRHFADIAPEDSYAFAVGGCSPNVMKPTGYAARFLKDVPADACRTVVDPPKPPHRKGPVFQAEADGVDTDPKTDDTEAMKRFLARLRGNPGSTGVLPAAWITVRDTLALDGNFSLEGAGVAAFDGGGGADGYFRTAPGADVMLKGLQICGGTTALTVVSGSRARVDSSFAYDQVAAAVRTERGSDFAWDGGVVYSSRLYEGEGRGFIGNVWLRYTPNVPPSEPLKPAAVIVNRGELEVWDLLGVPCVFDRFQKNFTMEPAKEIYEYRWVDNYGRYHSRAMRYGGEWGGIVPIFHFGKASTSFEGGYAWFWGLSVPHGAVVADSAMPDARAFAVVFPGYRKYLARIEMLYRDRPDRPLASVPSARLDLTFPLK